MKLNDLFEKPIDRPIEGVIKADDEARLLNEVEEYIITNEVAKHLQTFLEDAYNAELAEQGVWISGFFGSGKSHLLKMLSLVLDRRSVDGHDLSQIFIDKIEDSLLKREMEKAVAIPSKSILFNIDQQADVITNAEEGAILSTLLKVFNRMQGYYAKQPYIAQFERDLSKKGIYEQFKAEFLKEAGKSWEVGRETADGLENDVFAKVYANVNKSTEEQGQKILDTYREKQKLSIEDFSHMVKDYIDSQEKGFRLNFFIDEIGQFIADNSNLMLSLQTIAESFHTICRGQAWIMVTSQNDLSNVVGDTASVHTSTDFAKIQDRFPTRLSLTSSNVGEVIQQRLLAKKKDPSISASLCDLHQANKANFKTLFEFADGRTYRNFIDEESFCASYPFVDYQYDLFKSAIEGLSRHNAFTGKHASVGERSMLGVFQEVIIELKDQEFGKLATYDRMYEGLRNVVKDRHQSSIFQAEHHVQNPLAIRILKALFLLKYLKEFKGTVRNISILLTDRFDIDIAKHQKEVQEALNLLEDGLYIQRLGNEYSFLTDEEKDIEEEIKNTELDDVAIRKNAYTTLFEDIIKETKFRYSVNEQNYSFARIIDDHQPGQDHELRVHIITPFNDNFDDRITLLNRAMGRPEMLVFLPQDGRLYSDLNQIAKTEKFIRLAHNDNQSDSRNLIIQAKGTELRRRKDEVSVRLKDMLSESTIFVNNTELQKLPQDPKSRIQQAFEKLIQSTYPNLRMLRAVFREDSVSRIINDDGDDLFSNDDSTISEAEEEIISLLNRKKGDGERQTLTSLSETFRRKPYGWYQHALMANLAKLFMRSKIELTQDSSPLSKKDAVTALTNTHQFSNTIVQVQEEIDVSAVRKLKEFHQEFFNETNTGGMEARAVAEAFKDRLAQEIANLSSIVGKKTDFPFVTELDGPLDDLKKLSSRNTDYYLKEIDSFKEDLLEDKEEVIAPISEFVNGSQGVLFLKVRSFYNDNLDNLAAFPEDKIALSNFLEDTKSFRSTLLIEANDRVEKLNKTISDQLRTTRDQAIKEIREKSEELKNLEGFSKLPADEQAALLSKSDQAIERVQQTPLIAVVRDSLNTYIGSGYSDQLNQFNETIRKQSETSGETEKPAQYVTAQTIPVEFTKKTIESSEDLDAYLNALRSAYSKELDSNNRITL